MTQIRKTPCKVCGKAIVRSPMNAKVWICDGCLNQEANCRCKPVEK
jgi:ribosomal protein L37AE/L43A